MATMRVNACIRSSWSFILLPLSELLGGISLCELRSVVESCVLAQRKRRRERERERKRKGKENGKEKGKGKLKVKLWQKRKNRKRPSREFNLGPQRSLHSSHLSH